MRRLFFLLLLAGAGFADSNLDTAIGWLKSVQDTDTGEINHNMVWGTSWGTLALAIYGEDESVLNKSLSYIAAAQNNDGGIPYGAGYPSGIDESSVPILAFVSANRTLDSLKKNNNTPMDFIWSKQGPNGGFDGWGFGEDTVSTALAIMAFNKISENTTKTGKDPVAFLLSKQNASDGGFEWYTKPDATAQALIALSTAGINNSNTTAALYYLKNLQNETTGAIIDPFITAFSAIAFHAYVWDSENKLALDYLRSVQNESGRIGRYNVSSVGDEITTAISTLAFMNFSLAKTSVCGSCSVEPPIGSGVIGVPMDNQNRGDLISIIATQVENISVYLDGSLLGGNLENGTYSYNFTANQTGNFTLTFNISGRITERNFSVSDRYTVQITTPGTCTVGSAGTLGFGILDINGNAVQNATVFACFNGACAQTGGSSYQYTCAGSNSFYVNASKNGNFGSAELSFAGTNPNSGGGGGSYVTVEIEFPASSGKHDISRVLNYGECEYAYDCFSKVANLDCGWFSAGGALACPGSTVSKTCLASGVDGVKAGSSGWWSFYTNGGLSAWGISCYKVNTGDKIKFKYVGEYKTETLPAPQANSGTGLAAAPLTTQKNTSAKPTETPAQKQVLIEKAGFRMEENIGKALVSSARKSKASIVSGANAPCPTCDFASALLLKSGLDGMDISTEVTTDDRVRECGGKDTVIFVGGPAANRGVPASYLNVTGSADGAIYNITQNCYIVAGNTRELTNKAVSALMETFK